VDGAVFVVGSVAVCDSTTSYVHINTTSSWSCQRRFKQNVVVVVVVVACLLGSSRERANVKPSFALSRTCSEQRMVTRVVGLDGLSVRTTGCTSSDGLVTTWPLTGRPAVAGQYGHNDRHKTTKTAWHRPCMLTVMHASIYTAPAELIQSEHKPKCYLDGDIICLSHSILYCRQTQRQYMAMRFVWY